MSALLSSYSAWFVFAALCVAAFGIQGFWLWKARRTPPPWLVWVLAAVLLLVTWHLADEAALREQHRIERLTADFARLYGDEMQKRGHARLAADAAPDDPLYLELIETEKRWLALSPSVSDIYTLRQRSDGKCVFVVDSETDYDRNGKYEGEREQRTALGEVYEEADAAMERAFRGEPNFTFEPVTDRWGTWVSAYVPLRAPDGRVEGVLGVDFDAGDFAHTVAAARLRVLGLMALMQMILLGASTVTALLHAEAGARQRAHAALQESEERFRQMADNTREVFWMAEPDGSRVLYVSPAYEQVCARTRASLYAEPGLWTETIVAEDRPRWIEAIGGIAAGRAFEIEFRITLPDGSVRWIRNRGFPVRDSAGAVCRACGLGEDITERRLAEADLAQVEKELRAASRKAGMAEVATNVLHNVGNVLNSVNTSLSVAAGKVVRLKTASLGRIAALLAGHAEDLPAFFAEHPQGAGLPKFLTQLAEHFTTEQQAVLRELEALRGNVEHVNEIVAMQQSYAGVGGVVETLPLRGVIDDALRMNAASFARHGTRVECEVDPALPPVSADRNKLLLILVNLVRNAKYACDDGGTADKLITVHAQLNGGGLAKISVADNGIGIPPENLTRIFEHGFTTRKDGHGFGLHSSALAASEMGGFLRVQSAGTGHGATFTIELPLAPAHP